MNMEMNVRRRILSVLTVLALAILVGSLPAGAADTAKVEGTVNDAEGKPLAKVEVYFENAEIKNKVLGPVKTNKKGRYVYPFLDIGIENKWRVVPKLPGYLILKMSWKIVDSQRQDRGHGEVTLNSKQELPVIEPKPTGDVGLNEVSFVLVKEGEFAGALRKEAGAGAATAPAAGATPGGTDAAAPAPAAGKSVSEALELITAGKNEQAIPILADFLEKNPNNAPVQFTLGKSYITTKQYQEAVPPLKKSLAIDPNHAGSHFYLGIAYDQMGEEEAALQEFLAEIPISPGQDTVYSNVAAIYEKLGKLDEALEYYKKAAEIDPSRAELHASMASIHEKKGNQAAAEVEYKALADVDPANASVTWFNIGAIARNNGKNGEAVRAFKKAVGLDPAYALAHRELGYCLVKEGEFQQAVTHFKRYLELSPRAEDSNDIREMVKQLSQ